MGGTGAPMGRSGGIAAGKSGGMTAGMAGMTALGGRVEAAAGVRTNAEIGATAGVGGVAIAAEILDQFVIEEALLEIGAGHLDADAVSKAVYAACTAAYQTVAGLVEFVKI